MTRPRAIALVGLRCSGKTTLGRALARELGLDPARVAMVGDSRHDLEAGRAAGMRVVAVLTGVARREDLEPHADVVLPDIGAIPDWLSTLGR